MLPSLMIIGLGLLMPVTCMSSTTSRASTSTTRTIKLHKQPDYLQKHKGSSINYATCEDYEAHDEGDYEVGDACHYNHYQEEKTIEEEFPGVRSCCPFHGHLSKADKCQGKDETGTQVVFEKAKVCVKPIEGQDNRVAKVNLNCSTSIVDGIFDGKKAKLSRENNIQVLQVDRKTYTNFCIGIKCDSDDAYFERHYEACEETIEVRGPLSGTRCCGKITDQALCNF